MPEKKKVGRPKKNERKNVKVHVRISDKELKKLVFLMETRDLNASEAFRYALNFTYDTHS